MKCKSVPRRWERNKSNNAIDIRHASWKHFQLSDFASKF